MAREEERLLAAIGLVVLPLLAARERRQRPGQPAPTLPPPPQPPPRVTRFAVACVSGCAGGLASRPCLDQTVVYEVTLALDRRATVDLALLGWRAGEWLELARATVEAGPDPAPYRLSVPGDRFARVDQLAFEVRHAGTVIHRATMPCDPSWCGPSQPCTGRYWVAETPDGPVAVFGSPREQPYTLWCFSTRQRGRVTIACEDGWACTLQALLGGWACECGGEVPYDRVCVPVPGTCTFTGY